MVIDTQLNDGRAIFNRINESHVQKLVNAWIDQVAIGLVSLIHVFTPSVVVLGGGVMEQSYAISGVMNRVNELRCTL